MKLTISKETLLEQLTHVVGAVEKKHTSKILENILIQVTEDKLQLVGTDLEIEMSSVLDIQAESAGQITAPARKLFDICKALPADCFVLLETEGENEKQRLHIKGVRSRFELATLPADEYPLLDDIPIKQEINIPEKSLKALMEKVSFSMANQDVRYYLNGLLLAFSKNTISTVSTDGHRLAISEYISKDTASKDLDLKIIVPRKGILELSRLLDSTSELPVTLQISDNHIRINKNNIRYT
jgi:DNA polymerase-3 subunit beta